MNDPIAIDLSGTERIIDPPIIDFLAHDEQLRAYTAEFIPDPHVSKERKESVYIRDGTATARRVGELLSELGALLGLSSPIARVGHAGRDNFDVYTLAGTHAQLHDSLSSQRSFEVYAVLQVLSQEVQLEFLTQRRSGLAAG